MALNPPVGLAVLGFCFNQRCLNMKINKDLCYRVFILFLTFLCYTAYHMSRKPLSVVKNVLVRNCSSLEPPRGTTVTNENRDYWCNYPPFNVPDADEVLGTLDSCFLFSYAVAMFFSGVIAERVNLRYFLSLGMLTSGLFAYLFGLGYAYQIHNFWYYVAVQVAGGIVQTTGWPSVVSCVSHWFGKGRRGLIFGIWNSHTSVGNILGSLIAGAFVASNWGLSFMVPGAIIGFLGFIIFLFLVVYPEDVGCSPPDHYGEKRHLMHVRKKVRKIPRANPSLFWNCNAASCAAASQPVKLDLQKSYSYKTEEEKPMLGSRETLYSSEVVQPISFRKALSIPGVIEFSLCLFFAKLVSYTFLYWLPRYINISTSFTAEQAANLSTLFDVGGIVGGIIAGLISDHSGASASTCMGMLLSAIPMLFLYEKFGHANLATNIGLLMVCGVLVNGPYALITTAVSAELGTHRSLSGNAKALATVASIIDGTGSMGAAVGPLLAGVISVTSWENVFIMLMVADVAAMLLLLRLVKRELFVFLHRRWEKKRYLVA